MEENTKTVLTWLGVGLFAMVMWNEPWNHNESTRKDRHPEQTPCQQVAIIIYSENLEEALSDPYNTWQINGDRNAYEYAERSRGIALSGCTL